jgi:hypothetical protein
MEIFNVNAGMNEHTFNVVLNGKPDETDNQLARFTMSFAGAEPAIDFSFDLHTGALLFHVPTPHIDPCLVKCGVSVVANGLISCLKPWPTSVSAFLKCLKENGITIGANAAACILRCKVGSP